MALAGCATQPQAYDPSASRALNLAKAAGLSEAEDYAASKMHGEGIDGLLDITTSALSFESVNGLDPFLETSLVFEMQGKSCGVNVRVYKTQTVGPKPMPPSLVRADPRMDFWRGTRSSTQLSISVAGIPIPFTQSSWPEGSARRYRKPFSFMSRQSVDRTVAGRRPPTCGEGDGGGAVSQEHSNQGAAS